MMGKMRAMPDYDRAGNAEKLERFVVNDLCGLDALCGLLKRILKT
jgi:hypothetical protein